MHEGKHLGVMTTFKKPTAERGGSARDRAGVLGRVCGAAWWGRGACALWPWDGRAPQPGGRGRRRRARPRGAGQTTRSLP